MVALRGSPAWVAGGLLLAGCALALWLRAQRSAPVYASLRTLRPVLRARTPAVVETHVLPGASAGPITVYLACERERDRPELAAQAPELQTLLATELRRLRTPAATVAAVALRPTSREAVAGEGGWYAYTLNVP